MLRNTSDRRTLGFIVAHLGLVAAAWWAWPSLGIVLRALLVVALAMSAWIQAVITHNTMHHPMWRARWLNRLTQVALSISYGFPVSEFGPGHNLSHHKHLQTSRDLMRTSKLRYRWNLLNVLLFFFHIGPGVTVANLGWAREMRTKNPKWLAQLRAEIVITWSFKLALAVVDWRRALFLLFIPALYAVWGITSINFLQHDGCDAEDPVNHSRNFVGKLLNWFTFNNGFHGIHHMHPGKHWSELPAAHARELHGRIDPALEQRSVLAYAFRAFVLPGHRLTFRNTPVVLPDPEPDELWFDERARVSQF